MGGNKKAHRTKGNLRPSSSGRSAELLSVNRTNLKRPLCFPELSVTLPNYVPPVGQQVDDSDSAVDGNFRMVMRKMTKRDATTKLKAMQEFSELCKEKDEETVKGILVFWPRLYNKMAVDCDRRVREATHQAHEQLVLKVGRNIAPYLKSIMGVWLLCQCDPYAPAASSAKAAFIGAFPLQKHLEVYMFCKDEIFNYFADIIFHQTPQSLSDEKITPKEEMENKYIRMISCCFLGMEVFTRTVTSENDIEDSLSKILIENKFWKFSKHKDPLIRGSWYTLIISLCQCSPNVLNCHTSKLCPATLGCLAESDPSVAPAVWEAALHTVVTFEDCWQNVNVKKTVLPQLQTLLQEGGKGNAVVLFPSLLPLLSKIPQDVDRGIDFYQSFFTNLLEGLSSDTAKKSPSEFNAVVQAYLECFGYVISCNLTNDGFLLLENLISNQLLPVLQSSFVNPDPYLARSCFYTVLGDMLRYMEHKIQALHKENKGEILNKILTLFWDNFITMSCSILESHSEVQEESLNRLSRFFHSLHCSNEDKFKFERKDNFSSDIDTFVRKISKHKAKVTFEDEFEQAPCKNDSSFFTSLFSSVGYDMHSKICSNNSHLVSGTYNLCRIVLNILQKNMNLSYLQLFTEMVGAVPSEELFESLLSSSGHQTKDKSEAALIFFDKIIWCWLTKDTTAVKLKCIINLIFSVLPCLNMEATLLVLNKLCTMKNPVLLHLILQKCLDNYSYPGIRQWLKGSEIGESIVTIATELSLQSLMPVNAETSEVINAMWKCLSICFSSSKDFKPIILPTYLEQTLCIFHTCLKKASQESGKRNALYLTEFVCELASTLFSSFQECFHLAAATDLLVSLFCLSCQSFDHPLVGEKIMHSWQQGGKHLIQESRCLKNGCFLDKASKKIHDMLMDLSSLESSERLLKPTIQLLKSVNETLLDEDCESTNSIHPIIFNLLEIILPSENEWLDESSKLNKMALLPSLFDDLSLFPLPEDHFQTEDKITINHAMKASFTSEILVRLIISQDKEHFMTEEVELIMKHLPHVMFATVCCNQAGFIHMDKRAENKGLDESDKSVLLEMSKNSSSLLNILNGIKEIPFLQKLENLSVSKGYSWTLVLWNGIKALITENPTVESFCLESSKKINKWNTISELHTLQALIPHLHSSHIASLVVSSSNSLVCSEEFFPLDGALGYLVVVSSCIYNINNAKLPAIHEEITAVVDFLMGLKRTKVDFLCDCDISHVEKDVLCFISQSALFLSSVVEHVPSILTSEHWDFILCTVVGWLQTISKSKNIITHNIWCSRFVEHTCWLLRNASILFESPQSEKINLFSDELSTEWKELYSTIIYAILLPLFAELSGQYKSPILFEDKYLKSMAMALENIPADYIMKCPFPNKLDVVLESEHILPLPEYIHSLLNHLAPLLTCETRPVQLGAHCLLMKIMGKLPEVVLPFPDDKQVEREENNSSAPPAALEQVLKQTTHVVEIMLCDVRVGECCVVEPYTDAYTYATGYLLTWLEVLEFFSRSNSESRSAYACYLRDSGLLQHLLSNLFRLMPANPTLRPGEIKRQSSPCKGGNTKTMFTEVPALLLNVPPTIEELQHLACHVYICALKKVPALVRQWWNNQDKRTADIVNRFTSKYVSGCICAQEIQAVHEADKKFNNMIVKARPVAREVVATYVIDEMSIELSIQLPSNHPLGPVAVESQRRVGVSQTLWRNWMLQLTTFLTHQNGSILDGLALWKHSVDKRFEGVEECMICFYVLHGSTYQLPRLTCRTCKKRFHSPCLYKWFSTSNNSTCPLCRNLF